MYFKYIYIYIEYNRNNNSEIYTILGARETAFIQFFCRNSAATTPNTRVPSGSFLVLRRMQALSSKRIYRPSGRAISFLVRTTSACFTSPFLTFCDAA